MFLFPIWFYWGHALIKYLHNLTSPSLNYISGLQELPYSCPSPALFYPIYISLNLYISRVPVSASYIHLTCPKLYLRTARVTLLSNPNPVLFYSYLYISKSLYLVFLFLFPIFVEFLYSCVLLTMNVLFQICPWLTVLCTEIVLVLSSFSPVYSCVEFLSVSSH